MLDRSAPLPLLSHSLDAVFRRAFNRLFSARYCVTMIGGAGAPLYLPSVEDAQARPAREELLLEDATGIERSEFWWRTVARRELELEAAQAANSKLYEGALLIHRDDYASSVLHEAAHWCIAGKRRRTLIDFGYDYTPPPRTVEQSAQFLRSETNVQGLELYFSRSAQIEFAVSLDEFGVDECPEGAAVDVSSRSCFERAVDDQAARWTAHCAARPDCRAAQFAQALTKGLTL